MVRIEERDMTKISKLNKNSTKKINPCKGRGQIHYYKYDHLKGKNALIVTKKVTSICFADNEKIKQCPPPKYS